MKKPLPNKKVNKDLDEEADGVSYEKGLEFEKQFATFLRDQLNWDKVRVGAHMQGYNNAKGTSIDVFGERLDALGEKYKQISNKWIIGSVVCGLGCIIWHINSWDNDGFWFSIVCLLSVLGAFIFRLLSEANNKQNAWVECKNLKGRVNINHISKMLREYNDFKASKNSDHRFTHVYFASANGYVENALKIATDNNVLCYTKKGNSFVEDKYWDEKK